MRKLRYIIGIALIAANFSFALNVGDKLPDIALQQNSNNKSWSSKELLGKVHILLYMDPDKKDQAMPLLNKINNKRFDKNRYSTVAIVNLAATWMPNFALKAMLKKKQKELKNTIFVFDDNKYLIDKWGLKDNDCNVLVVDKNGKILYEKKGKMSKDDIKKIFDIVENNLKEI